MNDRKFIKVCLDLAQKSLERGDNPFGALIVYKNKIISTSGNRAYTNKKFDLTLHAEILAIKKAVKILNTTDLSKCILYSSCEPCPMCAFMIREYKIKKVVFSVKSPHMGGYSKWKILQDKNLYKRFKPYFGKPPKIISNILEKEGIKIFKKAGWTIYKK